MKQEDQIVVRCSQALKSRLRQYAADQRVDLSSVVRAACEAFVARSMTTYRKILKSVALLATNNTK